MPAGYSPVLDEGINFYAPEWQDVIASAATGCAKNGIPFDKEMEMITAKGNRIWVRTIGEAVRDTHGKIYKIQGSFQDISERKRVEGQMRESEERFRILLQNVSSVSVQGYAPDGTTQYWNKASEQLYGYTEEEAVGRNLLDLIIPPEMKEDVKQAIQQMAETGKPVPSSELSLMRRDGSRVAVYSSHAIVQVPGKNSELFCIDIDISDRKSTEAALHESEEIFSQFLEKSPIYVFFKDENIRSLRLSRNFEKMLGKPMQEMLGKSMDELFPTEFAKRMVETDRQILQKGEETNYEEEFNGRFYSTTKFPIQINGKSAFLAGFTIDITDQKLAEAEVLRSKQQYDNLVSKIPVGVYILKTKPDGFFALEYASPRMAELLGLRVENLLTDNETIFKAIHPEDLDSFIRLNHAGIMNKVPFDWKGRVVVKGDIRWLHISSNPEQLESGEMLWHGLIVDITERMRDEAEIKLKNEELTNLNATKDKFFSIIAHDLKSPFNSIIGFSSLLSRQLQEKDFAAIERYAGIIQNSSLQAMDLLMNLLEWSRSQTGRIVFTPENIDLSVLINQTIELFYGSAQHKSITIYSEIALTRSLSADKAMINTILRNLISNAIKFTKTGGEIIVSAWQMSNDVVVSVSDNGVGMDEESIAKLFRIDQNHSTLGTEKEKGTGLGLLLCSEFVEKHSGRIWVESTPGKGSKFSFTIPETKIPNTLL
jgi:PAS domain S-box-containing protein